MVYFDGDHRGPTGDHGVRKWSYNGTWGKHKGLVRALMIITKEPVHYLAPLS